MLRAVILTACCAGTVSPDPFYFPDDDDITQELNGDSYDWREDWRYEEFPEGFEWSCCKRRANEGNCIVRRHLAAGDELSPDDEYQGDHDSDNDRDDEEYDSDEEE